jgi:peroxiredoxin
MERNDETNVTRWVDDRMAKLRPDLEWEPSLMRGLALLRAGQRTEQRRGKRYTWLMAVAVAMCVPLVAMPATRAFARRCVNACVSQSGWVRGLLTGNPGPSVVYIKSEDRKAAPDFTLSDASGNAITLSALRGKVVLLNFWATWCTPCNQEIPWFVELQNSHRSAGLEIIGVSLDEGGWEAVKPFIEARHVNYRVAIGNQEIAGLYGGVSSLPATFIIDRSGRIAAVHVGLCSQREYEGDISAALQEQ